MHALAAIVQQALYLVLVVSGPPVMLSLLVGFTAAVFQATTQINEQNIAFVGKVTVVFGFLAIGGPWVGHALLKFAFHVFDQFPSMIRSM